MYICKYKDDSLALGNRDRYITINDVYPFVISNDFFSINQN